MEIVVYRSMTHLTMDCFQSEDDCLQFFPEFQINYFRRRIAHYDNIQENDTIAILGNIGLLYTHRYSINIKLHHFKHLLEIYPF